MFDHRLLDRVHRAIRASDPFDRAQGAAKAAAIRMGCSVSLPVVSAITTPEPATVVPIIENRISVRRVIGTSKSARLALVAGF